MDFSRLSVHSRQQVKLFLNFFTDKRKSQNLYAHEEFIAMHEKSALMGDLLGQDDVNELLDETEVQVMDEVNKSLTQTAKMSGVAILQFFQQMETLADERGLDLHADDIKLNLGIIEDAKLLAEIERMETAEISALEERKKARVKLDTLGEDFAKMKKEKKELKSRVAELEELLERARTDRLNDQEEAKRQIEAASAKSAGGGGGGGGGGFSSNGDESKSGDSQSSKSSGGGNYASTHQILEMTPDALRRKCTRLQNELRGAKAMLKSEGVDLEKERREALKAVMRSTQFAELRKIVKARNQRVAELSKQLRAFTSLDAVEEREDVQDIVSSSKGGKK